LSSLPKKVIKLKKRGVKILLLKKIFFLFVFSFCCGICFSQQRILDSLQNILKTTKEDTIKVNILDKISKNDFGTGNYDSAFKYALLANNLAKKLNFPKGCASALNKIGSFYYVRGQYDSALTNFSYALKILEKTNDKSGMIKTHNIIGNVYYDMGNYLEALINQKAALKLSEEINDKEGITRCYNNMGNIFYQQGNYPEALKNHLRALQLRQRLGDKHGIAASYHNIANIYTTQKNYSQALKNYLTALKVFKEVNEKKDLLLCYLEIGTTYSNLKRYDEALKYCFSGMELSKELGYKREGGVAQFKIGSIHVKLKNYEEGLKNNLEALRIADEVGDEALKAEATIAIGIIYVNKKDYTKALNYLKDGLKLSKEIGSLEGVKIAYDFLEQTAEAKGDEKMALQYYRDYTKASDSLFNEENTKKMVRSEMNFDFAKKEAISNLEKQRLADQNQIQLLQIGRRNYIMLGLGILLLVIISIAWLVLRQNKLKSEQTALQLEQKLLRSQMNPHFIFNALATIESFIYENQPKEAGRYLSDFARLMRLILDNSTTEYISLEKEIKTLEYYLSLQKLRLENNLIYTIEVADLLDTSDVLIPPMLTQPFIENAIEHGFRGSKQTGEITISFKELNNQLVVEVKDNGIGINKAKENEKEKQHKSMALQITKERLAVLNRSKKQKLTFSISDVSDENKQSTGTKVIFSIPL
jgi:tetratricopeptide (TPR) repeat protein